MNKIGWCDLTLNPFVGCSKCSPGCDNCYAEKFASRLAKNPKTSAKYSGVVDNVGKWTGRISDPVWEVMDRIPLAYRRIFIGSMTDVFHENIKPETLDKLFWHIRNFPQHSFLLLTKRPENAKKLLSEIEIKRLPYNVWLGVSVCVGEEVDQKIPAILDIPASIHFVSVEPMLDPVCFDPAFYEVQLNWVICGGETGPKARPMNLEWAHRLFVNCCHASTAFYFKSPNHKGKPYSYVCDIKQFPRLKYV